MYKGWEGFTLGKWSNDEVNVRDFIQRNYKPYDGDSSFLAGPTEATTKLWDIIMDLSAKERAAGGVLNADTDSANMWYGLYNTLRKTGTSTTTQMIWGSQYDQVIKFIGDEAEVAHTDRNLASEPAVSGNNSLDEILESDRVKNIVKNFKNNKKCEELCKHCKFIDK